MLKMDYWNRESLISTNLHPFTPIDARNISQVNRLLKDVLASDDDLVVSVTNMS